LFDVDSLSFGLEGPVQRRVHEAIGMGKNVI
jgi:hypothetical protein